MIYRRKRCEEIKVRRKSRTLRARNSYLPINLVSEIQSCVSAVSRRVNSSVTLTLFNNYRQSLTTD